MSLKSQKEGQTVVLKWKSFGSFPMRKDQPSALYKEGRIHETLFNF
jgi:hypothetical protein